MRKPTHQPAMQPASKNIIVGGSDLAKEFAWYQMTAITVPNTTSVRARQKKTVAGLKRSAPQRAFPHHTANLDHGERA